MSKVSLEDLKALPRWARVAFAVRCGLRVSGVFTLLWKDASEEYVAAVNCALELAARSARQGKTEAGCEAASDAADDAANGAASDYSYAANYAACAIADAAYAAYDADDVYDDSLAADAAAYACNNACDDTFAAVAKAAQRYDFQLLKRLSEIHQWDDDSPVDPDLCGPLWPEGVPEGWPLEDPDAKKRQQGEYLDVTFDLPPGVDDETAQQIVGELFEKLNGHYVAHGGSGLVLDNYLAFEPQPAEVTS